MPRATTPLETVGGALINLFARITLALYVDLRVEGAERLPRVAALVAEIEREVRMLSESASGALATARKTLP